MKMKRKYRIRVKAGKFVLQRAVKGFPNRWESRTLKPSEELWNMVCPDTKKQDVSKNHIEEGKKEGDKFAQDFLREHPKADISNDKSDTEPSEEDILKTLEETEEEWD